PRIAPTRRNPVVLGTSKASSGGAAGWQRTSCTVLAANYFMEVWLGPALGFDYPNARATVYGSGDRPLAWISYRDVAAYAAASLDCSTECNRVLSIKCSRLYSPN